MDLRKKGKLPGCDKWRTCSAPLVATWGSWSDLRKEYSLISDFDLYLLRTARVWEPFVGLEPFCAGRGLPRRRGGSVRDGPSA